METDIDLGPERARGLRWAADLQRLGHCRPGLGDASPSTPWFLVGNGFRV